MIEIDIEIYEDSNGKRPFEEWIKDLREVHTRAKILTRIDRLKMGNSGDCKTLQDGVCELRIHYGPGDTDLLWKDWKQTCPSIMWRR